LIFERSAVITGDGDWVEPPELVGVAAEASVVADVAVAPVVVEGDDGAVVLLPLVAVGWLEEVAG
jgi:hypothetical protein